MKFQTWWISAALGMTLTGCAGAIHFTHGLMTRRELVDNSYEAHSTVDRHRLSPGSPSVIYQQTQGSLSYPSPAAHDLAGRADFAEVIEVKGEACSKHYFIPLGLAGSQESALPSVDVTLGDKGYELARQRARQEYGVDELFDLRVDVHKTNYWKVYEIECLVIHALGVKNPEAGR